MQQLPAQSRATQPAIWTKHHAFMLCESMYKLLAPHGYYPALTGGTLYKTGARKDIDVVVFHHRQRHDHVNMQEVITLLAPLVTNVPEFYGFVTKVQLNGIPVDLFDPTAVDGAYEG